MIKRAFNWARAVRKGAKASSTELPIIKNNIESLHENMEAELNQMKETNHLLNTKLDKIISYKIPPRAFLALPSAMHFPCPICKSGDIKWASSYPSYEPHFETAIVVYCCHCGSGHVPEGSQLIEGYYEADYSRTNRRDRDIPPEHYFSNENKDKLSNYFKRARHQIDSLKSLGAKMGRVLDYGSGPGYLLHESQALEKFAVELDGDSDKYLDFLGAQKVDPSSMPENFFDVIVASHVVEHFTDSNLKFLLKNMLTSLHHNGFLLIEVPNGGHTYLHPRAKQDPHTIFFTPQGIMEAIERAGGEIIKKYTRAKPEGPANPHAVYSPCQRDKFLSTLNGGITIIAKRK